MDRTAKTVSLNYSVPDALGTVLFQNDKKEPPLGAEEEEASAVMELTSLSGFNLRLTKHSRKTSRGITYI